VDDVARRALKRRGQGKQHMNDEQLVDRLSGRVSRLDKAAGAVLASFARTPKHSRHGISFEARRAVFAAFEARRKTLWKGAGVSDVVFYCFYFVMTIASPLLVIEFATSDQRPIAWDFVGMLSTVVLLLWTYGRYTLKMVVGLFAEVVRVLFRLCMIGTDIRKPWPRMELDESPAAARFAFVNLFWLVLGITVAYFAVADIAHLWNLGRTTVAEVAAFNNIYVGFFTQVFLMSIIFFIMDTYVAGYDKSHAESFMAATSAVCTTLPMLVGLLIMGLYLFAEFFEARYIEQLGSEASWGKLSVDFVSGALSFQMIVSNVVFILIKLNRLVWAFYITVDTSGED
jgi:hypothetical protein